MFYLKEIIYPAHVLISFGCDLDNENIDFSHFRMLADISVLLIFDIIKIW